MPKPNFKLRSKVNSTPCQWDLRNVTKITDLFRDCKAFNTDGDKWDLTGSTLTVSYIPPDIKKRFY